MDCSNPFACILGLQPLVWGAVILRTAIVYIVVVVALRLLGKRELGQMTLFDFVLLLTLSNAVQNAMTGGDNSLDAGLISAGTLLLLDRLLSKIVERNKTVHRLLVGEPSLLISNGKFMPENMRREGIDTDELQQTLREHGLDDVSKVRAAILEDDGSISIIPTDAPPPIRAQRHRRGRRTTRQP